MEQQKPRSSQLIILIWFGFLSLYPASYLALRATRYLIHQDFLCLSVGQETMTALKRKFPQANSISVESERHQIGCGRVQKTKRRVGEAFVVPLFRPLSELEMHLRGYSTTALWVYDFNPVEVGNGRMDGIPELIAEMEITREQQTP